MKIAQWLLAMVFVVAGVMHFVFTPVYMKIVPPGLPAPAWVVLGSGACEILGGFGLLLRATQKYAAWGLVALLIAVLPANVFMAIDHAGWPGIPAWLLWVRVPLQLPLIAWAWLYARRSSVCCTGV